jgi:uncharacterized protein (DUF1778 family)
MRDAAINLRALPEQRDLIDHAASCWARTALNLCWKPLATRHKQ